jgi:hypothetical protein
MPSRARRILVLLALASMVAVIAAAPAGGGYYTNVPAGCVPVDHGFWSGFASWSVNVVRVPYFCSGAQYDYSWPCLWYQRPNGETYVPNCYLFQGASYPPGYVDFVDTRNISYGRARCKNDGPAWTHFTFCWAGAQ